MHLTIAESIVSVNVRFPIWVCQTGAVTVSSRTAGTYRGASAQQRKSERRRKLLDAGLEIIGTQGWANTTVRGVCERARVGPRFFYESFADLDELAAAVHDEIVERALSVTLQAVAAAPEELAAKTTAGVTAMIIDLTDDPRRARVAFAEAHASETLIRRRFAAMRTIADAVAEQAGALLDLPTGSDTVLRAFSLLVTGGVAEMVLVWLDGGLPIDRAQLIEMSVQFLLSSAENLPATAEKLRT